MEDREQFEKWQSQWDDMEKAIGQEPKAPPVQTSFYNNLPTDDFTPSDEVSDVDADDWRSIYRNALTIDTPASLDGKLLTEGEEGDNDYKMTPTSDGYDKRDGFGHLVRGDKQVTKGDVTYPQNPTQPMSIGPDTGKEYGPNRVTQNWTQGTELEELDRLKHDIEATERSMGMADIKNNAKERDRLIETLKGLRERISDLSEKMQPDIEVDVT